MISLNRDTITAVAKLTVLKGGGEGAGLFSLANACRSVGAIEEARAVINLLPKEDHAQTLERTALWTVLNEKPPIAPLPGIAHPTPFIRRRAFMPPDVHAQVRQITAASLDRFTSSAIHDGAYEGVSPSTRRSVVLVDVDRFRDIFLPKVLNLIGTPAISEALGAPILDYAKVELQTTCHGDGAFFRPHTDAGASANSSRKLSFVYYFSLSTRKFTGGDLLLYDGSELERRYSTQQFTRIEPEDNSLVLFPSLCTHEVETVHLTPPRLDGGRFSLNGWIH